MTSFLIHVLFISLIGTAAFLVVHEHERDVGLAYLLKILVVIVGSAAILHRLLFIMHDMCRRTNT